MEDMVLPARPMSRKKTAEHFDISKRTLDAWMKRGCPYMQDRAGGITRFYVGKVAEWLSKQDAQR